MAMSNGALGKGQERGRKRRPGGGGRREPQPLRGDRHRGEHVDGCRRDHQHSPQRSHGCRPGSPSGQQGGRRRGGAGCPGRRIQGRGGRGPGRRDVTKVARGAVEQALEAVGESQRRGRSSEERLMSDASLPGDFIGRHRGRGEEEVEGCEADVCGRSSSPGLLWSAFERTAQPAVLRCSLPKCRDSGFCSCWQASSRASLFAESEEFLKNLPEGVRILSGQLHVPVLV
jgi:hypothetical protein